MFEGRDEAICELLQTQGLVRLPPSAELRQGALTAGVTVAAQVIACGGLSRAQVLAAVAAHLGLSLELAPPVTVEPALLARVPRDLALARGIVPIRLGTEGLTVLALDPFDEPLSTDLAFALGQAVRVAVADPVRTAQLIQAAYGSDSAPTAVVEPSVAVLAEMAGQAPVVRFVSMVLEQAIRDRASDVHFEPFADEFRIRYRVDGALYEMTPPPRTLALPIASRLKVLADLDIAERRVPQDGRIRLGVADRQVDLRVSTLPTQAGESIVLRVLDASATRLSLDELGLPADILAGAKAAVSRPNGLFLVTGPTGSGKTTTLYGALQLLNQTELKLLTAEDPVEYELEGVMQLGVNPAAGLTFATALRAFLRQDPDVMMIGEIRDLETAQMAIQAALTGHLVLSTLHTNDAPTAIARLLDLGVEPFLVGATLEAVLAQRLVRKICPQCRGPWSPSAAQLQAVGEIGDAMPTARYFRGEGCPSCAQTGYRGRMGIFEWLPMTDALRELVGQEAPVSRLRDWRRAQGCQTLREAGLASARRGETTLEEVLCHT